MNILFLTTHLNAGGITSYLLTLSKGLVQRGHCVFVVSSGGDMVDIFVQHGIKHFTYNIRTKSELSPKIYFALPKLLSLLKEQSIEVIHTNTRITQVMGEILSRLTKIPHVTTCHGFFKPRLSRKIFPCWGKKVIAISPQVQAHLTNDFHVAPGNVALIQNGIAIEDFPLLTEQEKIQHRKEKGITDGPIIGIIARLSDVKGHAVLLNAMPQVLEKFPQAHLLIVGEGKLEAELREQAQHLGITAKVSFYPVVNRTMEFLPLFDVFVMPSLQEGLGLSVMEAQAAGLPVIASRVGGLPSLIEEGVTGHLVASNDAKALAQTILSVLQNPQKARVMGNNARTFIQQKLSADLMVNKTIDVYTRVKN